MLWRTRSWIIIFAVGLLLLAKLGEQLYRWVAYQDERAELRQLAAELDTVGLAVMKTQLSAESLRVTVQGIDEELDRERRVLAGMEERASRGRLSRAEYSRYRTRLRGYNRDVARRNAGFEEWKAVVDRNHAAVHRYNLLADSMRAVARRMGEPYYAVPTPAEVAVRHGLSPPAARN